MRTRLFQVILWMLLLPSFGWALNTVRTADYTYYPEIHGIIKIHNTKGTHTEICNEHCIVIDIAHIDNAFYVFGRDEQFGLFIVKLNAFDHFKVFTILLDHKEKAIKLEWERQFFFLNGSLIVHDQTLYCISNGFRGINIYSKELTPLGSIPLQSTIKNLIISPTGEAFSQSRSEEFKKIDLKTKTVTPYLTLNWGDRAGASTTYVYKYNPNVLTTGIILRDINNPQKHKTFLFQDRTTAVSNNIFYMMGYQGHIYVFTSDGKAYCIDETTLTCRKSVAAGHFKVGAFKSSHAHKGDIYFSTRSEYLSEPGELVVYNLDTKKWVAVQPKTEVQRLRTSTNSYLVGSNGTFVPLFPNRFEVSEHALTAYADCCKEAFRFHKDQLKVNVTPEFKQFVEAIEGTGRLCYEHIFDYIDPTLALLIIAHMENKDNYLLSGEWKLRRDRSYFLLLARLWQKKTDSAQSLLMGLMLIKDPVALKLYNHSRSYGVKDLGAKMFTKTQVDKLISGIGDLLL